MTKGRGGVVVDLSAVQSPDHRGRGVGRYTYELAAALERVRPELVTAYLLDPGWPPPGRLDDLLASGKVEYAGTPPATAALESAAAYLCCSPFELSRPLRAARPPVVDRRGLAYAAVAYDLIPLQMAEEYLAHPAQRRRYLPRLELLRHADALLAISGATADAVARTVGAVSDRCHVIGTGVSDHFVPAADRVRARAGACSATPGLAGPYLLYTGGDDGRKNVERLVRAFAGLSAQVQARYQLVVACSLPASTDHHYRHVASSLGIADRLVLTGFVPDDQLVLLYQGAELVVVPSLAEGYGIPVAEALACGTPVAVSDRPPFDELVPAAQARFDPLSVEAITRGIERCLSDSALRERVVAEGSARIDRWDAVASRAAEALEPLVGRTRRRGRRATRRLAVVSPFPPISSGVADYSAKLVAALARVAPSRAGAGAPPIEIDCFADGLDRYPARPLPLGTHAMRDARGFRAVDGALGGYDAVCYVLGNSECHAAALAALRVRPGLVFCHDVRLSGLETFAAEMPGAVPGGLAARITAAYGDLLPRTLGRDGSVTVAERDRFGLLMLRDVLAETDRLVVTSEVARRLAAIDAGPALTERIGVVPFAVSRLSADERDAVEQARAAAAARTRPLVASFGIVDPSKRPEVLVEAVGALVAQGREVDLVFVGPSSAAVEQHLRDMAARAGIADRVHLTGETSWREYLGFLGEATVAVQLREGFFGEASGAVSECLSAGLATVVSDVGWMGELPSTAVRHVARTCGPAELAASVGGLLDDDGARRRLGAEGERYAAERTFEVAAAALFEELGW